MNHLLRLLNFKYYGGDETLKVGVKCPTRNTLNDRLRTIFIYSLTLNNGIRRCDAGDVRYQRVERHCDWHVDGKTYIVGWTPPEFLEPRHVPTWTAHLVVQTCVICRMRWRKSLNPVSISKTYWYQVPSNATSKYRVLLNVGAVLMGRTCLV